MIGILGGTFDPVHLGHLHIANQVCSHLDLDEMQLMPCARPVHRQQPAASAEDRCEMIRLSLEGQPRLRLNTLELERDGPSYTVDSLRQLHTDNASVLVLVLGADAFNGFASWRAPDEVLRLAHIAVCGRPGFRLDADLYPGHRVDSVCDLKGEQAGAILPLEVDAPDCASSELRTALASGLHSSPCLPVAVSEYIHDNNLYRNPDEQINAE